MITAGEVAQTPQDIQRLESEDFLKCRNPRCDYWLSPEDFQEYEDDPYFSCPRCKMTYPLLDPTPFGNLSGHQDFNEQNLGPAQRQQMGETFVGLTMKQQGDIGEQVVQEMKEIPGYGPITWWSNEYNDPIDGGCGKWAIEVKTICIDIRNHRFIPGPKYRKQQMVERAGELGFKGILGLLVIVDYRSSLADVYLMEMPLGPWVTQGNRPVQGPVAYRKQNAMQLVKEVPFKNPFMDPNNPEPQVQKPTEIPF
jgi:hypothetical protein